MKKLTIHSRQFTVRTWLLLFIVNCLLFAACVPSETPEVLRQTPGAAVMVDSERYANDAFSVSIPAGWRVITAPAEAPLAVTFAAPDNCTLIHMSITPAEPPAAPACEQPTRTLTREIVAGAQTVYAAASAPISAWELFIVQLDHTLESMEGS